LELTELNNTSYVKWLRYAEEPGTPGYKPRPRLCNISTFVTGILHAKSMTQRNIIYRQQTEDNLILWKRSLMIIPLHES
jgi:hypothetical protein